MNLKKFFSILILIFSLSFIFSEEESVIKIEKAQKTEYKKDSDNKTETIVLIGDVKLSVTKDSKTTIITADKINFNRSKDILYAEGNVIVEQIDEKTDKKENSDLVYSNSLMFNTSTLEGVFDNGKAVQSSSSAMKLPNGSKIIVDSNIFGRDSDGTITFKSGTLTFCEDENPHWRIRATRIWLLPGNEFAFLNATLFVGQIPVFWLPLFYYPKDELIFNPSFGYKKRTGYFFNTTTYLYGRKSKDSIVKNNSSSDSENFNFFDLINNGELMEQRREGLVLHNLNKPYTGDTKDYFKIMVDHYENLGTMVGYDTKLSPNDYLKRVESNIELGFSNTIYRNGVDYFAFNNKGDKTKDSSNFINFKAPFRYQANLKMSFEKPFSLIIDMPVYSDPFFYYDFYNRVESMDWIDYAMNGGKTSEVDTTKNGKVKDENKEISRFTWSIDGNYSIPISDNIKPYIEDISLSKVSSSIVFDSKANQKLSERSEYKDDNNWSLYTPERNFYYPSLVTPIKISGRLSGSFIKIPKVEYKKSNDTKRANLSKPDELKTDEDKEKEENSKKEKQEEEKYKKNEKIVNSQGLVFKELFLPSLDALNKNNSDISSKFKKLNNDFIYNLGYSFTPEFVTETAYSAEKFKTPEDFSWSDRKSTYVYTRLPITVSSDLGLKGDFISLKNSFTFEPVIQKHPYLSDEYYDANTGKLNNVGKASKNADNNAKKLDLMNDNNFILKPFTYTNHFYDTSINWHSNLKIINTKYISENPEEPEWEYLTMELWNDECVTVHDVIANLIAREGEYSQSLILSSTLPPKVDEYKGRVVFTFPYASLSAESGLKQKSKDDDTWVKEDLSQSFSLYLFSKKLTFTQSYIYDFEEDEHESLKLSLSGYGAQFAYTASYVSGYDFVKGKGWKQNSSDEKKFQSYQLSLAYTSPLKEFKYLSERIKFTPNLSTSIVYDFLRPTSSYFIFKPGITFRINSFLDMTFSVESKNSSIYRYFCSEEKYNYYYQGVGERNIITDLKKSFDLSESDNRKSSSFKLQNFAVNVAHNLHDWDFNFEFKVSPRLLTENGKSQYDFSPYMTCSVVWRPMPNMKTEIIDEYGEWKLK